MFSITDYLQELKEAVTPVVARAEEAEEDEQPEVEQNDDEDDDEDEDEDDDDDDDDDDEEEEVGDQLEALREECKKNDDAKPLVHHYMECVERVHKAQEEPGYDDLEYKEDCIEEFFHLQHYLDGCVSPHLFDRLK